MKTKQKTINAAEIICVGTELLLGDIINTNASFMSRKLAALGIPVYRQSVVGDNSERLLSALKESFSRADAVFLSGGLGPTCDDLTKETVADYFGLRLIEDLRTLERIEGYFRGVHHVMTDNNRKQALIPEGATVFDNDYGTAPAIAVDKDGKLAVLLPGPPSELEPLWHDKIELFLKGRSDSVIVSHNIHILGMGESAVEDRLRKMMNDSENPTLAPYAKEGEVRLRVSARAHDAETADRMCFEMIDEITRTDVGPFVYGIDLDSVENALLLELRSRGLTVSAAESCTGGLIAKRITDIPGCSDVFSGGCVTYTNDVKRRLVGVKPETLGRYTAVSSETAAEMARGVRLATGSSIGISTTGIAGPGGGTDETPVGTVFIAVSSESGETVDRLSLSPTRSRSYIRTVAATKAMALALSEIRKKSN